MAQLTDWQAPERPQPEQLSLPGRALRPGISFFANDPPPGAAAFCTGTLTEEVFFVQEGIATFTAGDETFEAVPGQVVVVPPSNTPHKLTNNTESRVIITSIHPNPPVIQENLE